MTETLRTVSPIDGTVVVERPFCGPAEVIYRLEKAKYAQRAWRQTPLADRIAICQDAMSRLVSRKDELGMEITIQVGRPIRYTPREIQTMADRAAYMCGIAGSCLSDIELGEVPGFKRYIRHEPLGVVFAICPWNYPYLTAVNCVIPALLAGNSVLLKHSPQTPTCSEQIVAAFAEAGLHKHVLQYLHLTDVEADTLVRHPDVDFVSFTGSVAVGHKVQQAASERFIGVGLELGGKDPAYVRSDADLAFAAENIVDGAFFNSGQSCCAVERVYVHADVYDEFVERAAEITYGYVLDDPRHEDATLGPMVRQSSADFVRGQVRRAVSLGAKELIDESRFPLSDTRTPYMAPQILVDIDHSMSVMVDESFGPVIGIMKVDSDEEAIELMNDSRFGLTASIWTSDLGAAESIGDRLETGTVFMNRCDYLDPALAWTGTKDSGRGCTLSPLGFAQFTRPKSFHLRT